MDKETIIAKWFEGTISDTEFKQHVSEQDYYAYQKLKKATDIYALTQEEISPDIWKNIKSQIANNNKNPMRWWLSASAIAAIILIFFGLNTFLTPKVFTTETAYAEQKEVFLPDHSKAILSARSKLIYNQKKWDENRIVNLEGTCYFEVNKGKRFKVITPNGTIEVLGTKFSVVNINDYFNVTCYEGKVQVVHSGKKMLLIPGKSLIILPGQSWYDKVAGDKPAWLKGETRFKNIPLKYVLKSISNQFGIQFINKNVDENILFTGSYKNDDLNLSLQLISKALQIKYHKKDNRTIMIETK